jgi:hypothetical protein
VRVFEFGLFGMHILLELLELESRALGALALPLAL